MKKIILISIIFCILINPHIAFSEDLSLSAESSILIDGESGRVLYEKNPYKRMPMASTTKIMTALMALENGNLEDEIIIEKEWVGIEGSSIYLKEGEVLTLRDMLYGLMLRSGNDVSVAIAHHIGGSMDNFVAMMNEKAKSVGALNTNFTNPHGLHHMDHYSTAYDLALITREAFRHPEFANVVKSRSFVSNREINNYYYNKNKTLWEYSGGDGVKTGYTMSSGRCLVSSATRNNMRLISVSLNARNWFNDNYKLLDYGFDNYKSHLIYSKGQFIKKLYLANGHKDFVNLVSEEDFFYPLKIDEKDKIELKIQIHENPKAPIDQGEVLGNIYTYLDNQLIKKDNLISKSHIKKPNLLEKLLYKINH